LKLKLDENLRNSGVELLRQSGHDVATVAEQGLTSAPDAEVLAVCVREGRGLVTLDTDFANPLIYPPSETAGIAVIRADGRGKKQIVEQCIIRLIDALGTSDMHGKLWIVEPVRVREFKSSDDT
jgi:predicted nuclease of predicted toxin-antitoxin system